MTSSQHLVEIAIRVQLARGNKSQRWLAEQMGVSTHWLSRRMRGEQKFSTDDLDAICAVLSLSLFDLISSEHVEKRLAS